MNVFVVSIWLPHNVLAPNKHGVHFPVPEGIFNFLTLPFLIHLLPVISFRLLFLLKEPRNCILCIIHVWSLFYSVRVYISLHFLPIL